ncbi:MAG: hypothetical protein CMA60_00180 [Euryarchaeota archaeon]|nr:hypothetical protein [Euryarchaeota archaeon]
MRKNDAKALVNDAKRTSRKLGLTLYREQTDPNTGDRIIVERWQHGIPASFAGPSIENAIATVTGLGSVALVYASLNELQKSKTGPNTTKEQKDLNEKQARNSIILAVVAAAGFGSLLPVKFNLDLIGNTRIGRKPTRMFNGKMNGNYLGGN